MNLPAQSVDELISRQAVAVKEAILDAKKAEHIRIQKLSEATTKDRERELAKRFEFERKHDEDRITHLINDLDRVKAGAKNGEIVPHSATACAKLSTLDANRFALYETAEDVAFRKAFAESFKKHDRRFQIKQNADARFDYYAEKKKVIYFLKNYVYFKIFSYCVSL